MHDAGCRVAVGWALALLAACTPDAPIPASRSAASTPAAAKVAVTANVFPAPKRLVAIGDVHGDMNATKRALKLGGAIDDAGEWVGGDLFVVQVGDQLDRGDDDRAILDYFEELTAKAKAKGGTFLPLNGNHELMNVVLDFRYVTEGAYAPFADIPVPDRPELAKLPESQRPRGAAFLPAGPYAKKLAARPIYAIVGDSVFVHGGILEKHITYGLEKMDTEVRDWLLGKRKSAPEIVVAEDGPVWLRHYSQAPGPAECKQLTKALDALGAKRMVMGHTPQKPDISFACDQRAVRIDVGMAHAYGGRVEVLEIAGDTVNVLKE
ncbi:MAG: metallophosphoesterase [Myxococcales bacterium]|nr:metallophosphoesterase [Myxococcales bacterium]